ncbi:MAG: dTDP-4-dehydrorhamnose reductase [Bacteroidales bacterium]|nr:dTDP-4-dehydrorhamnose reductase [Bacteroidales bacterium]
MNILVTGANGQLGNEMRIVACGSTDRYIFTDINQVEGVETTFLDITDMEAVRSIVAEERVDAVVNCAAYTNVDAAETNESLAEKLNAQAPENLAKAMEEVGGLLVQISTDYVFGKEPYNVPCREDQKGTPSGVYGLTKLHGEERIIASGCKYVIIRTAWLYSEFGKNFCKTMLNLTSEESVAARVAAGKPAGLKVVFDQVGTPTYALDLARAIEVILADYGRQMQNGEGQRGAYSKTGVYHYSNEGVCSWYDFTKMIAEYSGQSGCDIQPCHSHEFPSPVKRPAYSVLDKTKIKEVFGVEVPYWTDSLRKCIANLKNV